MFLGLLNLLLLRGNSLNVDNSTEEFLADGTTSIPFEHFHRIGHSIAPENAFDFHVNCAGMIPSDCSKAK